MTHDLQTKSAGVAARHDSHPVTRRPDDAVAGPRSHLLDNVSATLNMAAPVQRLKALSGIVQRVIIPAVEGDDHEAVKQRLRIAKVPDDVIDDFHRLTSTHSEEDVKRAHFGPSGAKPMQSSFPKLVDTSGDQRVADNSLLWRGMSVQNVRNLKNSVRRKEDSPVFTTRKVGEPVTPVEHILDNHPSSPFLSFEGGGYGISAGKYAPKPVDETNRPRDVTRDEDGFLTQDKSYGGESRERNKGAVKKGYVAGVKPDALDMLDVSTTERAGASLVNAREGNHEENKEDHDEEAERKVEERVLRARKLAVSDREVLLTPGKEGIRRSQMPVAIKVQEVDEDYYKKKVNRQTATHSVGYFRKTGAKKKETTYLKLHIGEKYTANHAFDPPEHLKKNEDADESDISDVESLDLDEFDREDRDREDGDDHRPDENDGGEMLGGDQQALVDEEGGKVDGDLDQAEKPIGDEQQ